MYKQEFEPPFKSENKASVHYQHHRPVLSVLTFARASCCCVCFTFVPILHHSIITTPYLLRWSGLTKKS